MNEPDRRPPASHADMATRFYYLDPLTLPLPADPATTLDHAAALGFDAIIMPPPWPVGSEADRMLPARFDTVHAALGGGAAAEYIASLSAQCHGRGLALLFDLDVSRVSSDLAGEVPWEREAAIDRLDPRSAHGASLRRLNPAEAARWWQPIVARWTAAGLDGLRLLGLDHADPAALLPALRSGGRATCLIAWTPGLPASALPGFAGVDYVVASLPWWDGEASWFWAEHAQLRPVARVLACPEVPFGARTASGVAMPGQLHPALARAAALAAAIGDGWMMTAGFEAGARRPLDPRAVLRPPEPQACDLAADVSRLNAVMQRPAGSLDVLSSSALCLAVLRTDAADPRAAHAASLTLVNTSLTGSLTLRVADLLTAAPASFAFSDAGEALGPADVIVLPPASLRQLTGTATPVVAAHAPIADRAAAVAAAWPRVAIEAPSPCVDDGGLAVKRQLGEVVTVEADVLCDGHDKLGVVLLWRGPGDTVWREERMTAIGNDRFAAGLPLTQIGAWEYTVQAWRDAFASYRDELAKKVAAGLDVALELREGLALLTQAAGRAEAAVRAALTPLVERLTTANDDERLGVLLSADIAELMRRADDRPQAATLPRTVRIDAERVGAGFAAWFEVFPRSMSNDADRHGTFSDVEQHLPRIAAMGFDVLYFPPIHPIGRINRKGRNNTLTPAADDPGSPYAIGSADGGHDAIHPELGTLDDFKHLIAAAARHRLEIAIDFAIQCSPDHPWLKKHRDWFAWRPDGTIKYAENPPKKYEDIVNVDFYAAGAIPGLWMALANVVLFWCEQGVRLFRVDNPHTKPFAFWQWMIAEVRQRYPDAVFLAEAFTRPKVMYRLAKVGFSQSYTYFTWRETKPAMEAYLTELSQPGPRDFFRPHFFVNTPDINPVYLQGAGRPAYLIRAALAATLSGLWGVYNGFQLCEGTPVPGKEEYLDSEKYQLRAWDWDRPGNIVPEITALNAMRRANAALHTHLNAVFLPAGNDVVTVFEKATASRDNVLIVAISFDPTQPQATGFEFPFWRWQVDENAPFIADNLVSGERATWRGKYQSVQLTPENPYAIWRVRTA